MHFFKFYLTKYIDNIHLLFMFGHKTDDTTKCLHIHVTCALLILLLLLKYNE